VLIDYLALEGPAIKEAEMLSIDAHTAGVKIEHN
jgi:hypothetical protein